MSEGTNRYAPPASIRGVSLGAVRAQRKADKEVEELLQSESPHAGPRAFALGLATGAVTTMLNPMSLMQVFQEHEDATTRAHLAHWLTTKGMDEQQAHRSAAGLKYFLSMPSPGKAVEDLVHREAGSGYRIDGVPSTYATREMAETVLKKLGPAGKGRRVLEVSGAPHKGPWMSDLAPSAAGSQKVLDAAREAFEQAGKKGPSLGSSATAVVKRMAPYAATAGLFAGVGNVVLTHRRKKELEELRRYAREN